MATATKNKKPSPVETASSRTVSVADDGLRAVCVGAVERAVKGIEGQMLDKKARPAEGGYVVDLELTIQGDITVGAASGGTEREVPDFADGDLVVAMLASLGPAKRRSTLDEAIALIKRGRVRKDAAEVLEAIGESVPELVMACAKNRGVTKAKTTGARTGSIGGKPRVHVRGIVGERRVSFEVASE